MRLARYHEAEMTVDQVTTALSSPATVERIGRPNVASEAERLGERIGRRIGTLLASRTRGSRPRLVDLDTLVGARPRGHAFTNNGGSERNPARTLLEVARVAPELPVVQSILRRSAYGSVLTGLLGVGVLLWKGRVFSLDNLAEEVLAPAVVSVIKIVARMVFPILVADLIITALIIGTAMPGRLSARQASASR
jgi:hypothetical protein